MSGALRDAARQSWIYGLGNVATSLLAFFLLPLYTHNLSPTQYGAYVLLMMTYSVFAVIVDCGLTNSVARYFFNDTLASDPSALRDYRRNLASTALALSLSISVGLGTVVFALSDTLSNALFHAPTYGPALRIIAATVFFQGLSITPMIYLRVTERPSTYSLLLVGQMTLFLALNVLFVVVLGKGVAGILASQLISTAAWAVAALWCIAREVRGSPRLDIMRELLRFGLPFIPVLLLMWVIDLSDRYLLGLFAPTDEVGLYALGYRIGQVMIFGVSAFTMAWAPIRFKILGRVGPATTYARVALLYLGGAGVLYLALALFSSHLIALASPPAFQRASVYVAPIAFGYLIYGLFVLCVTGLGVAKRTASIPWITLVAAVLNVAFNIWTIPILGPLGAAYATILAYAIMAVGGLVMSQRAYPIPYSYGRWAGLIISMLMLSAVPAWVPGLSPAIDIALRLGLLAAYVAMAVPLTEITASEFAALAGPLSTLLKPLGSIRAN